MKTPTAFVTACLFNCALPLPVLAQQDNFNDGNDTGWTRFNPLGNCSFTFPSGGYRLSAAPSPAPASFGPARGGSLRQDMLYDRFVVCVDVLDWDPSQDASLGILARVGPSPGPGNVDCYALTFQTRDTDMGIEKVTDEVPTNLSGYADVALIPGHDYRLIFVGVGTLLKGMLFDLEDPHTPLATVNAVDSTYARGTCGVVVFSDSNTQASATFDNYSATEGPSAPLDDFNDGNDTGWTRYNVLGNGTYSFTNGHYVLASPATPNPAAGSARVGALRAGQTLSSFCISVDVVGIDTTKDQLIGLAARVVTPGLGTTDGYLFTYNVLDAQAQIRRITDEQSTTISLNYPVALDSAKRYHFTFAGVDSYMEGRIYDAQDLSQPLVVATAMDSTYASGVAGLVVAADSSSSGVNATFDTYSASAAIPPPLAINKGLFSSVVLSWDTGAGLCYELESSVDLQNWLPLFDNPSLTGKRSVINYAIDDPKRFFRLRLGPQVLVPAVP